MKNPHKHHIIPVYRCKELGIDPDFDENYIIVERIDHALIHWGYFHNDLEPLFKYITPAQWIINLIPKGDNRDVGAAILTARGELDGIDMSGENHPNYKHGKLINSRNNIEIKAAYDKEYRQTPGYKDHEQSPERKAYKSKWRKANHAKKKTETQEEGPLAVFMK
jgi:hypothetical protein